MLTDGTEVDSEGWNTPRARVKPAWSSTGGSLMVVTPGAGAVPSPVLGLSAATEKEASATPRARRLARLLCSD